NIRRAQKKVVLPSGRSLRFLMTVDGRRNLPYHCMAVHCCAVDSIVDVDSTHNLSLLWGIAVSCSVAFKHTPPATALCAGCPRRSWPDS
ncbi:hypothetical protein AVEN_49175-1, partial [Araneus ventricosus]